MWSWMQRRHPKPPRLGSVTRSRCFGVDHVGHWKGTQFAGKREAASCTKHRVASSSEKWGIWKMNGEKGSVTSSKSGKTWQPEKYHHLRCSHCVLLCFYNLLKVVPPRRVWLHMSATQQRCKLLLLCVPFHHGFNSLKVQLRRIAWCSSPTILRQFQRWWGPWWVTCLICRVWWVFEKVVSMMISILS